MRRRGDGWILVLLVTLLLVPASAMAELVVSRSSSLIAGVESSLRPGDRIDHAIGADGNAVEFRRCADWRYVEAEHLPRGPVRLIGQRDNIAKEWPIGEGRVVVDFDAPAKADAAEKTACALRQALDTFDFDAAKRLLDGADMKAWAELEPARRLWLFADAAEYSLARDKPPAALARVEAAVAVPVESELIRLQRQLRLAQARRGVGAVQGGEPLVLAKAAAARLKELVPDSVVYGRALAVWALVAPAAEGAPVADTAIDQLRRACGQCRELALALRIGATARHNTSHSEEALPLLAECLEIHEALSPIDYQAVADALTEQSGVAAAASQFALGEASVKRALKIMDEHSTNDYSRVRAHNALGIIFLDFAKYREALDEFRIAATLMQAYDPARVRFIRNNLGGVLTGMGDYAAAERELRLAADAAKQLDPGSVHEARFRYSLANVLTESGNYAEARGEYLAAIAIEERLHPSGELLQETRGAFGRSLFLEGKMDQAAEVFAKVEAAIPLFDGHWISKGEMLLGLGWFDIARRRGDAAFEKLSQSAAVFAAALPEGGAREGRALVGVGEALLTKGVPADALMPLSRAVVLLDREAPDQVDLAVALNARARAYRLTGKAGEARDDFCKAAEVLRRAGRRVGLDDVGNAVFRSRHSDLFRDCVEAQLQAGAPEQAFRHLEESRSRSFLDGLASRQINLSRHLPTGSNVLSRADGIARERRVLQRRLAEKTLAAAERDAAEKQLKTLADEQDEVSRSLRRVAPEIAALEGRSVESLTPILDALPAGAVALEYAVGFDDSLLFVLRHDAPLRVLRLAEGRDALARRVTRLRERILRGETESAGLRADSAELEQLLFGPVRDELRRAKRVVISPDGPLYDLPFTALWNDEAKTYWGALKPFSFTDSMTTWTHLSQRAKRPRFSANLGIADAEAPMLPADLRALSGDGLPRLPAARDEVRALRANSAAPTELLIGAEASEERVRHAIGAASVVHLAVHAIPNSQSPLDSVLLLGSSGESAEKDGLLYVHEVIEQLDVPSSLVVLSGCNTASGARLQGEGLIGFTRAFHYAGADAVLATLWSISDQSTGEFMTHFYEARRRGADDATALQWATKQALGAEGKTADGAHRGVGGLAKKNAAGSAGSHPYAWAAFQLYGASADTPVSAL